MLLGDSTDWKLKKSENLNIEYTIGKMCFIIYFLILVELSQFFVILVCRFSISHLMLYLKSFFFKKDTKEAT